MDGHAINRVSTWGWKVKFYLWVQPYQKCKFQYLMEEYIVDQTFKGKDYSLEPLPKANFENCSFRNCKFANTNLSGILFTECEFEDCDFSSARLIHTGFQEVEFLNCKLMGLAFETCSDFLLSFKFTDCNLHLSSFYRVKIPGTQFDTCNLREVDFTEADLSKSTFSNCDFAAAVFDGTNLEQCDFRGSTQYSLDPANNKIKKARFSLPEVLGLLDVYQIKVE